MSHSKAGAASVTGCGRYSCGVREWLFDVSDYEQFYGYFCCSGLRCRIEQHAASGARYLIDAADGYLNIVK